MTRAGRRVVVGITGASGSVYARRLIDLLETGGSEVHVVFSEPGKAVFGQELGVKTFDAQSLIGRESERITFHANTNLFSTLASGSAAVDAMVVCPCSAHSLAAIAAGLADTLLLRSAYVTLKERRRLVMVTREMPLTSIDLENMQRLTAAGGIIQAVSFIYQYCGVGLLQYLYISCERILR